MQRRPRRDWRRKSRSLGQELCTGDRAYAGGRPWAEGFCPVAESGGAPYFDASNLGRTAQVECGELHLGDEELFKAVGEFLQNGVRFRRHDV